MGVRSGKSSGEEIGLRDGNESDLGNFWGMVFRAIVLFLYAQFDVYARRMLPPFSRYRAYLYVRKLSH